MTNQEIAAMAWGLHDAERFRRELAERVSVETALRNALAEVTAERDFLKATLSSSDTGASRWEPKR